MLPRAKLESQVPAFGWHRTAHLNKCCVYSSKPTLNCIICYIGEGVYLLFSSAFFFCLLDCAMLHCYDTQHDLVKKNIYRIVWA